MADNSARISEIQALLESGATEVITDGTTVKLDHASLRKELRRLTAADDASRGRRPVCSSIFLGGF
jgi:hypothetical protein